MTKTVAENATTKKPTGKTARKEQTSSLSTIDRPTKAKVSSKTVTQNSSKPASKANIKTPTKRAEKTLVAKKSALAPSLNDPSENDRTLVKQSIAPLQTSKSSSANAKLLAPNPNKNESKLTKTSKSIAKTKEHLPITNSNLVNHSKSVKVSNTQAAQPSSPPIIGNSRFADRFAPARAPTRQMMQVQTDIPHQSPVFDPKLINAWKAKSGQDLTEEELLAMPESEYMNEKQLDFFRYRLQTQKDNLLSNAGETTEHLREDTSIVPDPADRATIEEEHALELRTRDRERKLLKKISQSLMRIESGEYGFCDETGEPIGLGRLIARPTATLSLEAQQRRELKQKMFGD